MEYIYKKQYPLIVLFLFFIWGGLSYQWYVCGIKRFCRDIEAPSQQAAAADAFAMTDAPEQTGAQRFQQQAQTVEFTCEPLITEYITLGKNNTVDQVVKLQQFLNAFEGEGLALDGTYDRADVSAVKRFQVKYRDAVLVPANLRAASGIVSAQTQNAINTLYCNSMIKQ
jgi:hypothetical protein